MNARASSETFSAQAASKRNRRCFTAVLLAALFGALSPFLGVALAEIFGVTAMLIGLGASFFLVAQYLMSKSEPGPVCRRWPMIAAMSFAPLFVTVVIMAVGTSHWNSLLMTVDTVLALLGSAGAVLEARH